MHTKPCKYVSTQYSNTSNVDLHDDDVVGYRLLQLLQLHLLSVGRRR